MLPLCWKVASEYSFRLLCGESYRLCVCEVIFILIFSAFSVDNGFPVVDLHFEGTLKLTVHPHEYLFQISVSQPDITLFIGSHGMCPFIFFSA